MMIIGKTIIPTPTAMYIPPGVSECASISNPILGILTGCLLVCTIVLTAVVSYSIWKDIR